MSNTQETLSRTDYEHIPEHLRITGTIKYKGRSNQGGDRTGAGRPKGAPNKKGRKDIKPGAGNNNARIKCDIQVMVNGVPACITDAGSAAMMAGICRKCVLEYSRNHNVTRGGYSFKRV